jgi:hypothetical protein
MTSAAKSTAMPGTEATSTARKLATYVKGSHTARVRTEQDERRVELLALRDVLEAQRMALVDQIEDIGSALSLLSDPGANVVPLRQQAGE